MKFVIGVDGGGTKTETVLTDEKGHVWARDLQKGTNALDPDVGMERARQRLYDGVMAVYRQMPQGGELAAIYIGVAGSVDWFPGLLDRELAPKLPCSVVRMEGDGGNLIAAMQGHRDGCGLIAGTGSALFIRKGEQLQRYGGYGHLIDTQGSGYTIGRDALLAAYRYYDGRGEKTILYDLIREQIGAEPIECLPQIYQGGRPYIARFAGTVFEARRRGDAVAAKIFDHAVHCLAELVWMGERELEGEFTVVTGGGLFGAFPEYKEALEKQIASRVSLVALEAPPVLGAVVEALWDGKIPDTAEFRENFARSYQEICG